MKLNVNENARVVKCSVILMQVAKSGAVTRHILSGSGSHSHSRDCECYVLSIYNTRSPGGWNVSRCQTGYGEQMLHSRLESLKSYKNSIVTMHNFLNNSV